MNWLSQSAGILLLGVLGSLLASSVAATGAEDRQKLSSPLVLPKRVYAVEGRSCRIRFDNLVFAPVKGSLLFDVEGEVGAQYSDYFLWNPKPGDSKPKGLRIAVYSGESFRQLDVRDTELWSADISAFSKGGGTVRWLAVGDSLTANGTYISETLKRMTEVFPKVKVIPVGTRAPKGSHSEIRHEGRPGWSWKRHLTAFSVKPDSANPFVFGPDGVADFDFARYLKEQHDGEAPQLITLFLGVNDLMGIAGDFTPEKVGEVLERARMMVSKIREAAPTSRIGVIVPPPCADQSGFGTNYANGVTEWQYRRALQSYLAGLLEMFDGRWAERIDVIPTYLDFDHLGNYPTNESGARNALHPRRQGYEIISETIFAWMAHLITHGEVDLDQDSTALGVDQQQAGRLKGGR